MICIVTAVLNAKSAEKYAARKTKLGNPIAQRQKLECKVVLQDIESGTFA